MFKNKICLILYAIFVLLASHACAVNPIILSSVELPAKIETTEPIPGKIAIMPPVGRILYEANKVSYLKGYKGYINYSQNIEGIIPCVTVEKKMQQHKELIEAYLHLVNDLKNFEDHFDQLKKSTSHTLQNDNWNGVEGIKYDNILKIYEPQGKNITADEMKIIWTITTTEDIKHEDLELRLSSSEALSEQLGADYLFIPIIYDKYNYQRVFHSLFVIPLWYSYNLTHKSDIAFYLIEGNTGKIVRASLAKDISPTLCAASIQRITGKGDFMGTLEFKEAK